MMTTTMSPPSGRQSPKERYLRRLKAENIHLRDDKTFKSTGSTGWQWQYLCVFFNVNCITNIVCTQPREREKKTFKLHLSY